MRGLVLLICLIVVYDIYCTVKFSDHMMTMEENAIASYLIDSTYTKYRILHGNGLVTDYEVISVDTSKLVAFKCLGLIAAIDIMKWLVALNTKWSRLIIYLVTAIHICLLYYLVM